MNTDTFLRPAVRLMDRMQFPAKFGLLFALILGPLVVLSALLIQEQNNTIRFVEAERHGLAYIGAARQPVEYLQQHRGVMAAILGGDEAARERVQSIRNRVDHTLTDLREVDDRIGDNLDTGNRIDRIERQWEDIRARAADLSVQQSFEQHTAIIAEVIELIGQAADASNITLDPQLDTYYLGDAVVNRLLILTEIMGQSRAVGAAAAANGTLEGDQRTRLAVLTNNMEQQNTSLTQGLESAERANPALTEQLGGYISSTASAVETLSALLNDELLATETIHVESEQIFDAATGAISEAFDLYDAVVPALDGLFIERIEQATRIRNVSVAVTVATLGLLAYLFAGLYRSIQTNIQAVAGASQALARGDLTTRLEPRSRDEMRTIVNGFNTMAESFEGIIQQLTSATSQLASASEELATAARESSNNVDHQRQETEQVATAMNEMTTTVQDVARNASVAAEATNSTGTEATSGLGVVRTASESIASLASDVENAGEAIRRVSTETDNISTVLDVINGIAEQTNLLALNAAIEAARAGETGRGFSVVAEEVRNLASRTQESTTQIRETIHRLQASVGEAVEVMEVSRERAQAGNQQANEAARALESITGSVARIDDMNTQIASAAEEQSSASEEMNRSIVSIRELAEEAASGAEQVTGASDELARLAAELQGQAKQFAVSRNERSQ